MQLTGKQIIEKGIITNHCKEGVQQQGIDVRLKGIRTMLNRGKVPAQGKTILPYYYEVKFEEDNCIELPTGYYEVEFEEACEIPDNMVLNYKTRSSLVRCGAIIHSGQRREGKPLPYGFEYHRMAEISVHQKHSCIKSSYG